MLKQSNHYAWLGLGAELFFSNVVGRSKSVGQRIIQSKFCFSPLINTCLHCKPEKATQLV
jgi:hypothetical protein